MDSRRALLGMPLHGDGTPLHGEPAGAAAGLRVVFGQSSADLALSSRPRPTSVAINLITTRDWRGGLAVEAGRDLTLHQGLGHWTGSQRTGSSTHALVEQVRRRSNMLHHVGRARRGLEPLMTFCLARAQVGLFCVALQPRKLCHAQERAPRRLTLAQSRLDVGLCDPAST